ncbi:hypothetical protein ACHAWX_006438 [Stephanocyclus meneghinianus]
MGENEKSSEEPTTSADSKEGNGSQTPSLRSKVDDNAALAYSKPSVGKLFHLMDRPEKLMQVVSFILMIGSEAANLITPLIVANAYDVLVNPTISNDEERMSDISYYMILAIIIAIAGIIAGFLCVTIQGFVGERVVARLRCRLYKQILKQEIAFFDEHKSGELVSRLGSDTTLLQSVVSQSLPDFFAQTMTATTAIILMFYLSVKLAGLALGGVLSIFLLSAPMGKQLGQLSKQYQDILGQAQTYSTEAIGSMRTVQAFAAERKEETRYNNKIGNPDKIPLWWPPKERTTYRVGFFKSMVQSGFFSFVFGAGFGFLNVTLWYGFYLVLKDEMTLGKLTAFNSYIISIGFAMGQMAGSIAKVFEGLGASGRVFHLLERVPQIPKPPPSDGANRDDIIKPKTMVGHVKFEGVSFSYPSRPDQPVLEDVTLTIPANTTTALVSSSGAGKSTVVSLLQQFYDITKGKITIDGYDLQSLDLVWLRQHIGYVQQEPTLFGLTIRENMLYGFERDITQEELEAASKDAHAHDFIADMPEGYDTLVGERGVKLSGGQKQRVAIARALLTNCRILLLDEATSALDAESEHLVQQAIDKAVVGRTVIVVAHRLSTIRQADQIVVMDNHRVVDVGVHDELLEKCSKYQDLIKRQSIMMRNISQRGLKMLLPGAIDEEVEDA